MVWRVDGIVYVLLEEPHVDASHVRALIDAASAMTQEGALPGCVDMCRIRSASGDAVKLATTDPDVRKGVMSTAAFLVRSSVARMIANLFIRVARPPYPARVFDSPSDALAWLRSTPP